MKSICSFFSIKKKENKIEDNSTYFVLNELIKISNSYFTQRLNYSNVSTFLFTSKIRKNIDKSAKKLQINCISNENCKKITAKERKILYENVLKYYAANNDFIKDFFSLIEFYLNDSSSNNVYNNNNNRNIIYSNTFNSEDFYNQNSILIKNVYNYYTNSQISIFITTLSNILDTIYYNINQIGVNCNNTVYNNVIKSKIYNHNITNSNINGETPITESYYMIKIFLSEINFVVYYIRILNKFLPLSRNIYLKNYISVLTTINFLDILSFINRIDELKHNLLSSVISGCNFDSNLIKFFQIANEFKLSFLNLLIEVNNFIKFNNQLVLLILGNISISVSICNLNKMLRNNFYLSSMSNDESSLKMSCCIIENFIQTEQINENNDNLSHVKFNCGNEIVFKCLNNIIELINSCCNLKLNQILFIHFFRLLKFSNFLKISNNKYTNNTNIIILNETSLTNVNNMIEFKEEVILLNKSYLCKFLDLNNSVIDSIIIGIFYKYDKSIQCKYDIKILQFLMKEYNKTINNTNKFSDILKIEILIINSLKKLESGKEKFSKSSLDNTLNISSLKFFKHISVFIKNINNNSFYENNVLLRDSFIIKKVTFISGKIFNLIEKEYNSNDQFDETLFEYLYNTIVFTSNTLKIKFNIHNSTEYINDCFDILLNIINIIYINLTKNVKAANITNKFFNSYKMNQNTKGSSNISLIFSLWSKLFLSFKKEVSIVKLITIVDAIFLFANLKNYNNDHFTQVLNESINLISNSLNNFNTIKDFSLFCNNEKLFISDINNKVFSLLSHLSD